MNRYHVQSADKVTTHRTKAAAIKEYFRRYHKGTREIQLKDYTSGQVLRHYKAKTVSPARIPNGRLVPARIRHNGHTYSGKVKRVNGRVRVFVTPQAARKINPRGTLHTGTRYRGVVSAIPGQLLRGGTRQVTSAWFASKQDARKWVRAMEQPGVETHRIEVGKGRIDIGPGGSWVR